MKAPSQRWWRRAATETLRPSGERRPTAVRLDVAEESGLCFRSKSYQGVAAVPAEEWQKLFGAEQPGPDEVYDVVAEFALQISADGVTIGEDRSSWSKLQELTVRAWAKEVLDCAEDDLKLAGSYVDSAWPPPVWRKLLKQRSKGVVEHFGYLLSVEPNLTIGRSHVLFICGRSMPDDAEMRRQLWDELFASAQPKSRPERRKIGRSMMLEIGQAHRVGTNERKIFVGPSEIDRAVWTPHYRWVVEQWFDETFKEAGYELELTGQMQRRPS